MSKKREPFLYYRGTQRPDPGHTVRSSLSFTPCLGAALIYSAVPGDVWSNRKTTFAPGSSVSAAVLDKDPALILGDGETYASVGEVLRALKYEREGGITHDEALKVYNYLHNRLIGKAKGGDFGYVYTDEEGEVVEDVPLSFMRPESVISYHAKEEFDGGDGLAAADRLVVDAFILADTPVVQRVAVRLGFKSILYTDVFSGGEYAAKELLDLDVHDLACVMDCIDLEDESVPCHETVRPLSGAGIDYQWTLPSEEIRNRVLAEVDG